MMPNRLAGVILAGGKSSRMGEVPKALITLGDKPLIAHVMHRLQPQVSSLFLSGAGRNSDLESFGLAVVPDLLPCYRGPLTGLYSALQHLADKDMANKDLADDARPDALVLCPCDAPFIPQDLVEKLVSAAGGEPGPVVVVSYQGTLQPTFSLWQHHHLPAIRDAVVNRGDGGLKHILKSLPYTIVEWVSAEPPPFYNVNTPEELKTAAGWLNSSPV